MIEVLLTGLARTGLARTGLALTELALTGDMVVAETTTAQGELPNLFGLRLPVLQPELAPVAERYRRSTGESCFVTVKTLFVRSALSCCHDVAGPKSCLSRFGRLNCPKSCTSH